MAKAKNKVNQKTPIKKNKKQKQRKMTITGKLFVLFLITGVSYIGTSLTLSVCSYNTSVNQGALASENKFLAATIAQKELDLSQYTTRDYILNIAVENGYISRVESLYAITDEDSISH